MPAEGHPDLARLLRIDEALDTTRNLIIAASKTCAASDEACPRARAPATEPLIWRHDHGRSPQVPPRRAWLPRALSARVSALACLPAAAMAAPPTGDDAELLAMESRDDAPERAGEGNLRRERRPLRGRLRNNGKVDWEAAWAFAGSYGRDAAIREGEEFGDPGPTNSTNG